MLRLADLLAGLARLADLGFGLAAGTALRAAALATSLGRSLDLAEEDVRAALYTSLLYHVGCIGYARETARISGDELVWNAAVESTDLADPRDVFASFLPTVARGRPLREQVRLVFATVTRGRRFAAEYATVACEVGRDAARRLGLPEEVQRSIYHSYESWDGGGVPDGRSGEEVPLGARLAVLASVAAHFDTLGGIGSAVDAVRKRAGISLDPELAERFADRAGDLLAELKGQDPRELVLVGEPRPFVSVLDAELVDVAAVFGDLADLKSPYTHGHSRGVAALAREAGERLGLSPGDLDDLEVAGHLHDVGRVAISTAVWEKTGRLTDHEWEQVRLHPYHSERILAGSERLSRLVPLVGMHHERCDGSGYHRGSAAADLSMAARLLAAADAYQAMSQRRPHREPLPPEETEQELLDDVRAGLLDGDAAHAVLAAAGHETNAPPVEHPAGLTDRQVEVLQLLAEGCNNPEIAQRLVISRRTAEQHVQNIYAKLNASSRAAAALFAMEHGLLVSREDQ